MISNLVVGLLVIAAAGSFAGAALRTRRRDAWRPYTPPTNEERMLRWIDRYAPPWAADARKEQTRRQWRRDAALDQRAARLARPRRVA